MDKSVKPHFQKATDPDIAFGDVIIGRRPVIGKSGDVLDTKSCPQLVVGIYHDDEGILKGFDTFRMLADFVELQSASQNPACLNMEAREWSLQNQSMRNNCVDTRSLITIKAEDVDLRKGAVNALPAKFIPDLIAARAYALTTDQTYYLNKLDGGEYTREGIVYKAALLGNARNLDNKPDVEKALLLSLSRANQDALISQDDIDAITKWVVKFAKTAEQQPSFISAFPDKGLWPLWTDCGGSLTSIPTIACSGKVNGDRNGHRRTLHALIPQFRPAVKPRP